MKKVCYYGKCLILAAVFVLLCFTPDSADAAEFKQEWYEEGDGWLYFVAENTVAVGWRKIGKNWYYFDAQGIMQTGWVKYEGVWFYLKANGVMATGWVKISGKYYYFDANGTMAAKEYRDGYWLTASGAWDNRSNKAGWRKDAKGWWYKDGSWYPRNCWLWIGGYCYHFDKKGYLSTNKVIEGCTVDAAGAWVNDWDDKILKNDVYKEDWNTLARGKKPDVTKYSYEVIPLLEPFNQYYYIMTDNPDPSTFFFKDKSTKYQDENTKEGVIRNCTEIFVDVDYEDEKTARVAGGYIAQGSNVDGGELTLCFYYYYPSMREDDWGPGGSKISEETGIVVTTPRLVDTYDYLLETYTKKDADFFANMDALQKGLDSICLYSGAYILGELYKTEDKDYYGISVSPHVDQNFYIHDPYSRKGGKSMFISHLYPYELDSMDFPRTMAQLAWKMDESCDIEITPDTHAYIDVTRKGKKRTYGGAGTGGGQGINEDQILYRFKFDGSKSDAAQYISMKELYKRLNEYGALEVDEDAGKTIPPLTWDQVKETVGDGAYASVAHTDFKQTVFTYLYDDGYRGDYTQAFVRIGTMENAWYDGRYFNKWEYWYPGAELEETVESVQPALVFKDYVMKLPDDGHEYISPWEGPIEGYDPETGVWEGYTTFVYDSASGNWISYDIQSRIYYWDENGQWHDGDTEEILKGITITLEEAKALKVDRNTNVAPKEYYVYDMETPPGTKKTN